MSDLAVQVLQARNATHDCCSELFLGQLIHRITLLRFVTGLTRHRRRSALWDVVFSVAAASLSLSADFQAYYNKVRSHASLKGHTPSTFACGHMVASAELNNVR